MGQTLQGAPEFQGISPKWPQNSDNLCWIPGLIPNPGLKQQQPSVDLCWATKYPKISLGMLSLEQSHSRSWLFGVFFQHLQCREALWGYFKLLGVSDAGNTQSRFWGSPWKEMPFPRGGGNVHPQNNILIQKNNWKEIFLTPGVGEDKKESGLMWQSTFNACERVETTRNLRGLNPVCQVIYHELFS